MEKNVFKPAERLANVQEYYFSRKLKEVARMNAEGKDIISLAIGSPDMPPSERTIETLCREARKANGHGYQPTVGTPELRQAMAAFYQRWYGVSLDPATEIQPLIGSKEGILHVTLAFVNPGEQVLVPNPGYPTYTALSRLLGAEVVHYDLTEATAWQPDFDQLEQLVAESEAAHKRIRLLWTNYPHMPTGAPARKETYERLVAFAQKHGIVVVNDNPYSFIRPDGESLSSSSTLPSSSSSMKSSSSTLPSSSSTLPSSSSSIESSSSSLHSSFFILHSSLNSSPILSLLQVPGAKDCCIEFNSMSKSHNMPGWRVGMLSTNATFIQWILKVKSNIDSGTFRALQLAAAEALTNNEDEWHLQANVQTYSSRRRIAEEIMTALGCSFDPTQTGMFLWGRIPDSYADVEDLTERVLHEARVFITPGFIFGSNGKRYIRISLCAKDEQMREALRRIKEMEK